MKLENYGVWVKSGPEDIVDDDSPAQDDFELTDLDTDNSDNNEDFLLTEEEENLLGSLEDDIQKQKKIYMIFRIFRILIQDLMNLLKIVKNSSILIFLNQLKLNTALQNLQKLLRHLMIRRTLLKCLQK